MKELHAEQCNYMSNILRGLIEAKDEEALNVIGGAMEEDLVGSLLLFWVHSHVLKYIYLLILLGSVLEYGGMNLQHALDLYFPPSPH